MLQQRREPLRRHMKKVRERVEEGLHRIENEKRPRVFRKKRGGLRLKAKYHRRIVKVLASLSVVGVLTLGVFGVNAFFFEKGAPNEVVEGFNTVAYALPTDGSTPDMHTALENIGYMNTRFQGQDNYYSEMHGVVDTILQQQVSTYKQYNDGVLILTDITTSAMVNGARQFCYVGDRVLWREAAGSAASYNGIDTEWKSGEPEANISTYDFTYTYKNGLPGTSFSVYVINEETLTSADPVVVNGDGTYSQTFYLNPADDLAPMHYINQMRFTGGISDASFKDIRVTYTFDGTWQVLKSEITESYSATMGLSVSCVSTSTTTYEYDTEKAESDAYESYYKDYADKIITGGLDGDKLDAAGCLAGAFGPVLTGPVNFKLDLTLNGAAATGLIYVDASDMANLGLRARLNGLKIGGVALDEIFIGYTDEQLYLRYGENVKIKAKADALLALVQTFLPAGDGDGLSLDTNALLAQLGGGDFDVADDGTSATLDSNLSLFGLTLPVHFEFTIGDDGSVGLSHISANLAFEGVPVLGDLDLGLKLSYADESVPALTEEEKAGYADLGSLLETARQIVENEAVSLQGELALTYQNTKLSLAVENGVIGWKGGFRLSLDLVATVGGTAQKIAIYADEKHIKLTYGTVGADLVYDELYTVGEAFENVYARLAKILAGSLNGVDVPADTDALFAQMGTGAALAELLNALDLPAMLSSLGVQMPAQGGLARVTLGDLSLRLAAGEGALSCVLDKISFGDVTLAGSLALGVSDGAVAEPEGDYMTAKDFAELLDFVGASVATLASDDVRLSFTDSRTVYPATGKTKFDIVGELTYHAGTRENGEPFVRLDTEKQTIVVNPNAYVYFKLWLDDEAAEGTDLFFEFWMFDYYTGDTPDGELDFFVSVSKNMPYLNEEGNPTLENTGTVNGAYQPLNFSVSAGEILTLASSGVSIAEEMLAGLLSQLGVGDLSAVFDVLDDYLVSKWLTPDEEGQLGALGEKLSQTLGLDSLIGGLLGGAADALAGETAPADEAEGGQPNSFSSYLTKLGVCIENGVTQFVVALDSDLIYGGSGLSPLELVFRKTGEAGASYLTGISLNNIYGNGNSERTTVNFAIARDPLALARTENGVTLQTETAQLAALSYQSYANYMFNGADELIKSLARSATHKTADGTYRVNDSFHISGSATIKIGDLDAVTIQVDGLSVSFDENDLPIVNLKISYSDSGFGWFVFGDTGTTELTIRDGMVYMRRTLEDDGKPTHRVMTMEGFAADLLNQLSYILCFSDLVNMMLPDSIGGGSGGADGDYGTILSNILTQYSYNKAHVFSDGAAGRSWQLTLNGPALTGNVLENIVVVLAADAENVLRTLSVKTSLSILNVDAALTFDNPCGDWGGKSDQTQDVSSAIPDLYNVTIIAPQSLGGKWEACKDASGNVLYYERTVQMFAGSEISFVYGDGSYTFTVGAGENVFRLADVEGLPDNILWDEGAFEYTAESARIEVALTTDTVRYTSTVAFTMGGAENVTQLEQEFYKDLSLTQTLPTAEGYTFLGWFMYNESGELVKVTELAYSAVGGNMTEISAMWVKNITGGSITATRTAKGGVWGMGTTYTYNASASIQGGELVGAYSDRFTVSGSANYRFRLALTDHANVATTEYANGSFGQIAATTNTMKCDQIYAEIALTYSLNGQTVGTANAQLYAKYENEGANATAAELQSSSVSVQ